MASRIRRFLRIWLLRLHRHLGLLLAPVCLVFAVSTLILNHPFGLREKPQPEVTTFSDVHVPTLEGLELAWNLASQLGVNGEVDWIQKRLDDGEIVVLMSKPGRRTEIRVDVDERKARVEQRSLTAFDWVLYLHKRPGPHVASIRGNWWVLKVWRAVVDFSVVGIFVVSLSGVYLWYRMPGERRFGLASVILGAVLLSGFLIVMLG